MLKTTYRFLIIITVLTFFFSCGSGGAVSNDLQNGINDTIKTVETEPEIIVIINETEDYLRSMGLINVKDSLPQILVDLKYSGDDNFLGFKFYGELISAFMQLECYYKLKTAYDILQQTKPGYTFIIYDAVRSIESQQLMWDSVDVPQNIKHWYVANPARGSIHNYGMAIDLSIVDDMGNVLDMGTDFDFFGELAYPDKTDFFFNKGDLSKEQYDNRKLLMSVMAKANFYVSKTEWWHYNASSLDYAKSKYKIFSYPPDTESNNDN